jgi:hypothetical protein
MDEESEIAARRHFLKVAAAGALTTLPLTGCSDSNAEAQPSTKVITIIGIVDVAQALADNSLTNNIYWFDNNTVEGSLYQGTDHLSTAIKNGNRVQWVLSGLQVETTADIESIYGSVVNIANPVSLPIAPGISFWSGQIVAGASGLYQYGVTLKVESRSMVLSSVLALNVV